MEDALFHSYHCQRPIELARLLSKSRSCRSSETSDYTRQDSPSARPRKAAHKNSKFIPFDQTRNTSRLPRAVLERVKKARPAWQRYDAALVTDRDGTNKCPSSGAIKRLDTSSRCLPCLDPDFDQFSCPTKKKMRRILDRAGLESRNELSKCDMEYPLA